ncbi:ABC transporter permease [Tessaracoccus terricola]
MKSRFKLPDELGILGVLVLVAIAMAIMSPRFATTGNLTVLLENGVVVAFLALGQTFVLLTGGIDLSVGSNIALTGMLAALTMAAGFPWWVAIIVAVLAGIAVGLFNGIVVHYVGLPPFIVTFATFGITASIPMILTSAQSVNVADPMFATIGRGSLAGIPTPVVLVVIALLIFMFILHRTPYGVHLYAVGGNKETSRLAGINIARVTISAYVVSGICAAMGGLITMSRLMVGYPSAGSGNEQFYSIASAVVGGVSLFGGTGTILGAFIGAILIATVSNGMNVLGVPSFWQPLVIGVIILLGVTLDGYRRRTAAQRTGLRRIRSNQDDGSKQPSDATGAETSAAAGAGDDTQS